MSTKVLMNIGIQATNERRVEDMGQGTTGRQYPARYFKPRNRQYSLSQSMGSLAPRHHAEVGFSYRGRSIDDDVYNDPAIVKMIRNDNGLRRYQSQMAVGNQSSLSPFPHPLKHRKQQQHQQQQQQQQRSPRMNTMMSSGSYNNIATHSPRLQAPVKQRAYYGRPRYYNNNNNNNNRNNNEYNYHGNGNNIGNNPQRGRHHTNSGAMYGGGSNYGNHFTPWNNRDNDDRRQRPAVTRRGRHRYLMVYDTYNGFYYIPVDNRMRQLSSMMNDMDESSDDGGQRRWTRGQRRDYRNVSREKSIVTSKRSVNKDGGGGSLRSRSLDKTFAAGNNQQQRNRQRNNTSVRHRPGVSVSQAATNSPTGQNKSSTLQTASRRKRNGRAKEDGDRSKPKPVYRPNNNNKRKNKQQVSGKASEVKIIEKQEQQGAGNQAEQRQDNKRNAKRRRRVPKRTDNRPVEDTVRATLYRLTKNVARKTDHNKKSTIGTQGKDEDEKPTDSVTDVN